MTLAEFTPLLAKLALQLRAEVDELTARGYHECLSDLELEPVALAQQSFARESGRKWMPTGPEWRARALACAKQVDLKRLLPACRSEPWQHECPDCEDTGWTFGLLCDGDQARCGRSKRHLPHSYTQACPCRERNRTYQRHRLVGAGAV